MKRNCHPRRARLSGPLTLDDLFIQMPNWTANLLVTLPGIQYGVSFHGNGNHDLLSVAGLELGILHLIGHE